MFRRRLVGAICLVVVVPGCADDAGVPASIEAGVVHVIGCNGLPATGGAIRVDERRWLTAAHVVRDVQSIDVATKSGDTVAATVVATDSRSDLAMLAVDAARRPMTLQVADVDSRVPALMFAPSGQRQVRLGDPVRVRVRRDDGSAREFDGVPVLDDVRMGDSGSALVQRGRLVGVVVLADTDRAQGFAVGGGDLVDFVARQTAVEQLLNDGCPGAG